MADATGTEELDEAALSAANTGTDDANAANPENAAEGSQALSQYPGYGFGYYPPGYGGFGYGANPWYGGYGYMRPNFGYMQPGFGYLPYGYGGMAPGYGFYRPGFGYWRPGMGYYRPGFGFGYGYYGGW
jgi:hypothetical protein